MNDVIDNGNPHAISAGDRWTPKLNGEIYCSPACGGRCKKVDFDQASERSRVLAAQLGGGWEPHVWENMGWHFEVKKGIATVDPAREGGYTATLEFAMSHVATDNISETRGDPRAAVNAVGEELRRRIASLQRALLSVSLDVIEIN